MADEVREVIREKQGASKALTWLALLLSIAALIIAIMAYNRAGGNISTDSVQQQTNDAIDNVQGQ